MATILPMKDIFYILSSTPCIALCAIILKWTGNALSDGLPRAIYKSKSANWSIPPTKWIILASIKPQQRRALQSRLRAPRLDCDKYRRELPTPETTVRPAPARVRLQPQHAQTRHIPRREAPSG